MSLNYENTYNYEISNDTVELKQTKFETCLKGFHSTL